MSAWVIFAALVAVCTFSAWCAQPLWADRHEAAEAERLGRKGRG